VITNILLAC